MAKSNSKFFLATILGLAAGIGIGILIAPAKGSKTRQRIRKKVIHLAESMEEEFSGKFQTLKSELTGKFDEKSGNDVPDDQINETKT